MLSVSPLTIGGKPQQRSASWIWSFVNPGESRGAMAFTRVFLRCAKAALTKEKKSLSSNSSAGGPLRCSLITDEVTFGRG